MADRVCWALPVAAMKEHFAGSPAVMAKVLSNLVLELSDRLRQSNRMVMSLR
ncbi:MAG: hypothetical protein AB7O56_11510 [Bauldia sp.]